MSLIFWCSKQWATISLVISSFLVSRVFFPQFDFPTRYRVRLRPTLWPGAPLDRWGPLVPLPDAGIDIIIIMVKMIRCQHHERSGGISNDFSTWPCESGNDNEKIWKDTLQAIQLLFIICHLSMQPSFVSLGLFETWGHWTTCLQLCRSTLFVRTGSLG